MSKHLSTKRLLSALERKGLISVQQASRLYANRVKLIQQFERRRSKQDAVAVNEERDKPFLFIDTIVALNIKRNDNPSKTLDEDTIFRRLRMNGTFLSSRLIR